MISLVVQCIGIALLMISIVLQCIGIALLMIKKVVQCMAKPLPFGGVTRHCPSVGVPTLPRSRHSDGGKNKNKMHVLRESQARVSCACAPAFM